MEKNFIKDFEMIEKTQDDRELELLLNIIETKRQLEASNKNFEFAENIELIDYYTYQIKAYRAKLDYLVKKAKIKGISLDVINGIELNSYIA